MEPPGPGPEPGLEPFQLSQDIHHLITLPSETSTSFTALLQLPPTHAMELLHSPTLPSPPSQPDYLDPNFISPANRSLIDRPVKSEPNEAESCLNSTKPLVSDPIVEKKGPNWKRKEREHDSKVKGASKKSKSVAKGNNEEGQVLPYVHVRARRGQATDSHSLAERARREKINAKMKLLQELVPGCNKISGTALILDEIINHVQSLQQQVEILSMRLAAVNMAVDFNLDSILSAEGKSLADGNFHNLAMPVTWPDAQVNSYTPQHRPQWFLNTDHHPSWESKEGTLNFVAPENSLLSYNNSANTDTLHLNLKQS